MSNQQIEFTRTLTDKINELTAQLPEINADLRNALADVKEHREKWSTPKTSAERIRWADKLATLDWRVIGLNELLRRTENELETARKQLPNVRSVRTW